LQKKGIRSLDVSEQKTWKTTENNEERERESFACKGLLARHQLRRASALFTNTCRHGLLMVYAKSGAEEKNGVF